jgi:rubrerythrin
MKIRSNLIGLVFCVIILFGMSMIIPTMLAAQEAKGDKTLENLQAAYKGESNANAKYLAYAAKADEEKFYKVARLFRATASAEEVHLKNHAVVIKSMGATPIADIKLPEIKSTAQNLQDAIKGETYEQSTMYPDFIAQAKKENNSAAVQTFTYALAVEAMHAKLYEKAVSSLDKWKKVDVYFYVCPICGYTLEGKPDFSFCPICATPAADFLIIS